MDKEITIEVKEAFFIDIMDVVDSAINLTKAWDDNVHQDDVDLSDECDRLKVAVAKVKRYTT
ncbi:MAG: hypothetical protein WCH09_04320 [Bacteroidota bacterium]